MISCPGLPGTKTFLGPLDFQSPTRAIPGQLDRPIPHLCFGLLPHFLPFLSPTLPSPPLPSQVSLFPILWVFLSTFSDLRCFPYSHSPCQHGSGGWGVCFEAHSGSPAPLCPHNPPSSMDLASSLCLVCHFVLQKCKIFFFFLKINLSKLTVAGKAHLLPKNDIINSKAKKKEQKDVEKKATILL